MNMQTLKAETMRRITKQEGEETREFCRRYRRGGRGGKVEEVEGEEETGRLTFR